MSFKEKFRMFCKTCYSFGITLKWQDWTGMEMQALHVQRRP